MKKQINLFLAFCLSLSPFSANAQGMAALKARQRYMPSAQLQPPTGPMSQQAFLNAQVQINNQYLKTLEMIKQQELENIQRLRQQYQEQQNLLMSQFNQAREQIVQEQQSALGEATAAQAVSLRESLQDKINEAEKSYQSSMKKLRKTFDKQVKQLQMVAQDAKENAKKQYNAFVASAKNTGAAAVSAAVNGLGRFGIAVGKQFTNVRRSSLNAFKQVRDAFQNKLVQAGLIAGAIISAPALAPAIAAVGTGIAAREYIKKTAEDIGFAGGVAIARGIKKLKAARQAASETAQAVADSIQTRMNNIRNWYTEGKDKLIQQIKQLNADALAIKNKLAAIGSKPFSAMERAEVQQLLKNIALNIGAIGAVGSIPVAAYHVGARSSFVQRMYEKAKGAVNTPIQKMANSWRQFKAKMNCLGNDECTEEQRKEAGRAFLKVYFTIYGLFVLAVFGLAISEAMNDEMSAADIRAMRKIPPPALVTPEPVAPPVPAPPPVTEEVFEIDPDAPAWGKPPFSPLQPKIDIDAPAQAVGGES